MCYRGVQINKGGGSGNHVLQGSSWQEIKEVLGGSSKEEGNHGLQGSLGYRGVHGKK